MTSVLPEVESPAYGLRRRGTIIVGPLPDRELVDRLATDDDIQAAHRKYNDIVLRAKPTWYAHVVDTMSGEIIRDNRE